MILEVEHLPFTYRSECPLFYDVNFAFEQGQVLSTLGVDGTSKSTLLNCITNLLLPQQGEIRLHGTPPSRLELREISRITGYVPQSHTPAYDCTVRDFVVMNRAPHLGTFQQPGHADYDLVDTTLGEMGLPPLVNWPYTELNGGECQQVAIAQVVVQQPELILLDEPTNHLDYGNQLQALSVVHTPVKRGFGVIMTNHNPDHVLLLDGQVGILGNDSCFLIGSAEEVMMEEWLHAFYRSDLCSTCVERVGRKVCIPGRLKSDGQEGKMESVEVSKEGKLLSFRFDEMLDYHGPGSLGGVAHGFKVMQRASPLLDDGNLLERRETSFAAAFPGLGVWDALGLVTRCPTDDRYVVGKELPEAMNELESSGGRYHFRLSYYGRSVVAMLHPGYVRGEFIRLARKKEHMEAKRRVLVGMKRDMAARLMTAKAENIYRAERLQVKSDIKTCTMEIPERVYGACFYFVV